LLGLQIFHFPSDLRLASIKELDNLVLLPKNTKTKMHTPGEINLQSKKDLICHAAKVKVATQLLAQTSDSTFG